MNKSVPFGSLFAVAFLVVMIFPNYANADKINLKNGSVLKGEVINTGSDTVTVETGGKRQTILKDEIMTVEYEKVENATARTGEASSVEQKESIHRDKWEKYNSNVHIIFGFEVVADIGRPSFDITSSRGTYGINADVGFGDGPSLLIGSLSSSHAAHQTSGASLLAAGPEWNEKYEWTEYDVGGRYYFHQDTFNPYLSIGVGFVTLAKTITCTSGCAQMSPDNTVSDNSIGFFFNPGLLWQTKIGINFGLDFKILVGANLKNTGWPDYLQTTTFIGYGW